MFSTHGGWAVQGDGDGGEGAAPAPWNTAGAAPAAPASDLGRSLEWWGSASAVAGCRSPASSKPTPKPKRRRVGAPGAAVAPGPGADRADRGRDLLGRLLRVDMDQFEAELWLKQWRHFTHDPDRDGPVAELADTHPLRMLTMRDIDGLLRRTEPQPARCVKRAGPWARAALGLPRSAAVLPEKYPLPAPLLLHVVGRMLDTLEAK